MNEPNTTPIDNRLEFKTKHKFLIALFLGLISFFLSPYGLSATLGSVQINIPWSLFLPVITALAYGWRYALVAGIAGGALFPFYLWPENGWANVGTFAIYLCFYGMFGLIYNKHVFGAIRNIGVRIIMSVVVAVSMIWIFDILLFNLMLSFNPPIWAPNAINNLSPEILHVIAFKDTVSLTTLILVSDTLLRLPFIRSFFGLQTQAGMRSNNGLFAAALLVSYVVWFTFIGLGYVLFTGDDSLSRQHVALAFFVIISSGIMVSRMLFYYSENQFNLKLEQKKIEEKYKALFNFASDAIIIIHQGIIIDGNPASEKVFGCDVKEIIGRKPSFFSPTYQPCGSLSTDCELEYLNQALEGIPQQFEWQHTQLNATLIDVDVTLTRMEIQQEVVLQAIVLDISERKRNQEQLQKSEQMLKTVLDHFPGIVFWKDQDSVYLGCNQEFATGAGLSSPAEIVGKTDFDMPWAETEAVLYRADDKLVMSSGTAKLHILEMQHQIEGHVIWLDTSKVPFHDLDGNVIGVIGVSTDITEIKQSEEVISAKNKELENYLYIASHDLRSPLVNIQGFSQRLQKQTAKVKSIIENSEIESVAKIEIDEITNGDIPKTLNFIFSNVTKMDTLISGLLQISRTGRMAMTIRKISMNELLNTVIAAYNFQLTEISAKVVVGQLDDCYGDENQLNQLFSNIIGNAIKYRDKKRMLVLEIASRTSYNKVIFSIKDTGMGISPRHIEKIWDVFFRVDSGSPEAGEGIGLSLAKRIADKHKGKIWAESEEGKGSTFFIELNKNEIYE
jgi:PAS domain S-box-containing protein